MATTIAEQLYEEGYAEGFVQGLQEGFVQGLQEGLEGAREEGRIAVLRAVLVSRFGSQALDAACDARLRAATAAVIDRYLQRVAVADSLAAVFEE